MANKLCYIREITTSIMLGSFLPSFPCYRLQSFLFLPLSLASTFMLNWNLPTLISLFFQPRFLSPFWEVDLARFWRYKGDYDLAQSFSSAQSCPTLCDPMNRSTPGLPVHHHLQEFTHSHVHRVSDAIQPSHPLSSPSPPAPNPSQHQSLFQWVNSLHEVAKVLEFQL